MGQNQQPPKPEQPQPEPVSVTMTEVERRLAAIPTKARSIDELHDQNFGDAGSIVPKGIPREIGNKPIVFDFLTLEDYERHPLSEYMALVTPDNLPGTPRGLMNRMGRYRGMGSGKSEMFLFFRLKATTKVYKKRVRNAVHDARAGSYHGGPPKSRKKTQRNPDSPLGKEVLARVN